MRKPAPSSESIGFQLMQSDHINDARIFSILKLLSVVAVIFLLAIGFKSHLSGHDFHSHVLFGFAAAFAINMGVLLYLKKVDWFRYSFVLIATIMLLYLTASGGESNTGPLWFYAFPAITFFVFGIQLGATICFFIFSCVLIIFRLPDLPFVTTSYPIDFQIRFLAVFGFVAGFSFVLDYSRRAMRNDLIDLASAYEKASRTDYLTELSNRRDMNSQLAKEFHRYQRNGRLFSVILMDIDLFKKINDNFGHDAGDAVLSQFADLLKLLSRKVDTVSRWGGEEFLMLLPDTSLVQALATAERLRQHIEKHIFRYQDSIIDVTVSAGVCAISQFKSLEELLKQTDINLYESKMKGRNCITPNVRPLTHDPLTKTEESGAK